MVRSIGTALTVIAGSLALAGEALASTVTVSGGNRVNVQGQGSEANQLQVSYDAALNLYAITDVVTLTASGACANVNATTATCPGAGITTISVDGQRGSDLIALDRTTIPISVVGNLSGSSGDDVLSGHNGTGTLRGGSGRDFLDGGPGSDDLRGGRGTDTVYYGDRLTGVNVTVGSGSYNDGNELDQSGSRRDNVRGDIEVVLGGLAADLIVGDGSSETLIGGAGDDLILGGRGNDVLIGGDGNDFLFGQRGRDFVLGGSGDDHLSGGADRDLLQGEDGNDRLFGGSANDRIFGGLGDDFLVGKKGNDKLFGNPGNDRLFGGPGHDFLNGGAGFDRCVGGKGKDRAKRCQVRKRIR